MSQRRVILADSDAAARNAIKALVKRLDYLVVGEAAEGVTAIKLIRTRQPDLILIEAQLSGMDGWEVSEIAWEDKLAPVILLSNNVNQGVIENARSVRGAALLQKPVNEASLLPAMELAISNFEELIKLDDKVKELKETLEKRKVVEKAKGILMDTLGFTEAEAFKKIQKQSMNKRVSIRAVADAIIMTQNLK
ncbi:MAG: ANTAR domain-containing protein [Clostridiales bacterium]|nr:ANTAR domain-containing protein [Clostridiales bacterium]MCF8023447.1 ANTAR domain-containing protein [Clostridiales bacterium]